FESEEEKQYYAELSEVHTVCISGGRDSGKTFAGGIFNTVAVADYGHRILYTRYTLSSADNSIEQAQQNRIELLGLRPEFNITNKSFEHKKNGGKIDITGQKTSSGNQTAKMKSLEDYSIFITEEAEELTSYEDWEKTTRSLRAKDVQTLSILIFNPPTKAHWIYERLYSNIPAGFNGIKNGVLYIHTTYLDNGKENMTAVNWNKYEAKRKIYEYVESLTREERELIDKTLIYDWQDYKTTILGGFREVAEGVIYDNWEIGEFDESLPYGYGLDFGSRDPDAMLKAAIDEKNRIIYLDEVMYKSNQSSFGLIRAIEARIERPNDVIVGDSQDRRMRHDLYDAGFNIKRAHKPPGSVIHTIKTIQSYKLVVTEKSVNL
ncbi:MAG: phage terminase large subunit, partial [Flammeovirgaceae bacterium]